MIDIQQSDAKAIFLDALDCTSADEINRFLDKACGTDSGLRQRVEKLLQAHRNAGAFLGGALESDTTSDQSKILSPGTRIGPYLLRELIGEGGMGLVFVADQEHPVRRRVALKVVKPGMDTRQVLARFEAERRALALMDHPNIARVLDGGTISSPLSPNGRGVDSISPLSPSGRGAGGEGIINPSSSDSFSKLKDQQKPLTLTLSPGGRGNQNTGRSYFVMELVRGVPITDYCDQARLTTRQRLELFLPVCRAIQHAHQKGIIHRDIKPSNLLVTLYDSHPVPKVIDFGIAKAVGTSFADHSVYTGFAQLVGTPMYMSPEQAEMTAQDVDTRADVYALGVVLYELLTGTTPFDGETLRQAGFDEMRRIIREDEPARPSQRVTTLSAEMQTTVSGQRGVDGRQLGRQLRGGLDWVVMTCLAKDRTRRYESAGALAADIERYLRDEAVEACPPSTSYRVRTFARRHRRMLVTVGVIAVALVTATAVSVWQAVKARDAQHQAEADRDRTKTSEAKAATEAAITRAVSDFLQRDLLSLAPLPVQLERGLIPRRDLTVREALDRAAGRIDERFQGQPLIEAEIRLTIGKAYSGIFEYSKAFAQVERAVELRKAHLGIGNRDTLLAVLELAALHDTAGQPEQELTLLAEWREQFETTFDTRTREWCRFLGNYAVASYKAGKFDDAERIELAALEIRQKIDPPTYRSNCMFTLLWLSRIHLRQKKCVAAESDARAALAILEQDAVDHPLARDILLSQLGGALLGQSKFAEAEPFLLEGYHGLANKESFYGSPREFSWLAEAIERLTCYYAATNQPVKARMWMEKLPP